MLPPVRSHFDCIRRCERRLGQSQRGAANDRCKEKSFHFFVFVLRIGRFDIVSVCATSSLDQDGRPIGTQHFRFNSSLEKTKNKIGIE